MATQDEIVVNIDNTIDAINNELRKKASQSVER